MTPELSINEVWLRNWLVTNYLDIEKEVKGTNMCEHCYKKDKKDPSDYIFANDNDIIFIKTHEGIYLKAKDIRSFRVVTSGMTGHHYVEAAIGGSSYVVEKFEKIDDAKAFLKEFLEDEFNE